MGLFRISMFALLPAIGLMTGCELMPSGQSIYTFDVARNDVVEVPAGGVLAISNTLVIPDAMTQDIDGIMDGEFDLVVDVDGTSPFSYVVRDGRIEVDDFGVLPGQKAVTFTSEEIAWCRTTGQCEVTIDLELAFEDSANVSEVTVYSSAEVMTGGFYSRPANTLRIESSWLAY
jgi:hypothetical protein